MSNIRGYSNLTMDIESSKEILTLWKERNPSAEIEKRRSMKHHWLKSDSFYTLFSSLDTTQKDHLSDYITFVCEYWLKDIDKAFVIGFKKGFKMATEIFQSPKEDQKG